MSFALMQAVIQKANCLMQGRNILYFLNARKQGDCKGCGFNFFCHWRSTAYLSSPRSKIELPKKNLVIPNTIANMKAKGLLK